MSGTPLIDGAIAEATGSPTAMQPKLDDLATALTNSAARNGEGPATADWPMAGFKLTGLAAGSSNGDSVRFEQVQPIDPTLTAFAALSWSSGNQFPYFTAADTFSLGTISADALLLLADPLAPRLGQARTWTATQTAGSGATVAGWRSACNLPHYIWFEEDGTADNRDWIAFAEGDVWQLTARNDAATMQSPAMRVLRSGVTLEEIELNATLLDVNGTLDLSGSIELGHPTDTTLSRVSPGVVAIEGVNIVTVSASQTLTNKIINLGSNTLNGSTAQFNTALNDGDFATLAGSETLTNKTLTSPTINGITGDFVLNDAGPTSTLSAGYRGAPQNTSLAAANYTLVLADAGKHLYHTDAGTDTLTIPANGSVALPVGTVVVVVNGAGAGNLSIAITTDTLLRADGVAGTGTRTVAASSVVTLLKVGTTTWVISGSGIS